MSNGNHTSFMYREIKKMPLIGTGAGYGLWELYQHPTLSNSLISVQSIFKGRPIRIATQAKSGWEKEIEQINLTGSFTY